MRNTALGGALGGAALASLAASTRVDFARVARAPLQPRDAAFAIWGLLYALLGAQAVAVALARLPVAVAPVALTCASLVLTAVWTGVYARTRASAGVLLAAAACAWGAAALAPRVPAYALYAGWLSVACALAARVADPRLPALLVAAAAVAAAQPLAVLPLLWALALQEGVPRHAGVAAVLGAAGGAGALARAVLRSA